MIEKLFKTFQQEFGFSKKLLEEFSSHFERKTFEKGDFILKEGQVCHYTYFVNKGFAMYYQLHDGNIVPCDFASENDWVCYIKSFSTGTPSDMIITALEPMETYALSKTALQNISKTHPQIFLISNFLTEHYFVQNTQHASNLAKLNAKERYLAFQKNHSDWLQRIPQYYVASYLGIKPQSLSRIKKELSKKS